MIIDYREGDTVSVLPADPGTTNGDAPNRPVMVMSIGEFPPGTVCHRDLWGIGCCGLKKAVHFLDWPDPAPAKSAWLACRFRKCPHMNRDVESETSIPAEPVS